MAGTAGIDRTVTEVIEEAWSVFFENIALFVISGLIHLVLSIVTFGVMAGPLTVGFLDQVRRRRAGEHVEATDIFRGNSHFVPALIATVLIAVGVGLGLLLLVLPGIYLALYWFLTLVVMAYEGSGAMEAMARSGEIFNENKLLVLVVAIIAAVLNSLGGSVVLGALVTSPFTLVMCAIFYEKVALPPGMQAHGVSTSPAQVRR